MLTLANRSDNTDTNFRGAISGGLASGTIYMTYEHVAQNLHVKTDMELDQDKRLYLSKTSGQEHYFESKNVAGAHHVRISNEDPNGEIRLLTKRDNAGTPTLSVAMFVTPTKVSVPAPYTLEGDLVDTSDKTKKV